LSAPVGRRVSSSETPATRRELAAAQSPRPAERRVSPRWRCVHRDRRDRHPAAGPTRPSDVRAGARWPTSNAGSGGVGRGWDCGSGRRVRGSGGRRCGAGCGGVASGQDFAALERGQPVPRAARNLSDSRHVADANAQLQNALVGSWASGSERPDSTRHACRCAHTAASS
jgi:hypothetical protein